MKDLLAYKPAGSHPSTSNLKQAAVLYVSGSILMAFTVVAGSSRIV